MAKKENGELSGVEKAAILLISLGPEKSANIFKHLKEEGYRIASSNIIDVYNEYCDYYMFDYKKVSEDARSEIKELCKKHNIDCIYNRVDSKDDVDYTRSNNVDIIYGDYYKKAIRIKSLITKLTN